MSEAITKGPQSNQQDSLLECAEKGEDVKLRRRLKLLPKRPLEFLLTDIKVKIGTLAFLLALFILLLICHEVNKSVRRKAASLPSAPLPTLPRLPTSAAFKRAVGHETHLAAPTDLFRLIQTKHLTIQFSLASFTNTSTLFSESLIRPETVENVLHLSLRSPITQNTLHYIFKRFHNIQTLEIDVDAVCSGFQAAPSEDIESSGLELPSLASLTLKNGVHCSPFAWGFTLKCPAVTDVFISGFQLDPDNFQALYSTLEALEGSLSKIAITRSFICAEDDEEICDINNLKFSNVKQLSVTKRIEDKFILLNSQ